MRARGLPVERFGSGSNARNFKNWKYAKAPECGLPVTADIISRAFDVRLPLLFEEEDFEIMVEIIQESLAEVAAGELEVKEQEVAHAPAKSFVWPAQASPASSPSVLTDALVPLRTPPPLARRRRRPAREGDCRRRRAWMAVV